MPVYLRFVGRGQMSEAQWIVGPPVNDPAYPAWIARKLWIAFDAGSAIEQEQAQ